MPKKRGRRKTHTDGQRQKKTPTMLMIMMMTIPRYSETYENKVKNVRVEKT